MTDKAISPLRRRMIEDMTIRGLADKTQKGYIRHIKNFAIFFGRSPDQATSEDVRRYRLHMKTSGATLSTMAGAVSALKFLFNQTLGRRDIGNLIPTPREVRKLPVVLSEEEVERLLNCAPGLAAFIASATTVCSQNADGRKTLHGHASCWRWRSHRQSPTHLSQPKTRTTNRQRSPVPVPNAAGA